MSLLTMILIVIGRTICITNKIKKKMKKDYTASFYSPLWHVRNPKQKSNIDDMLFAKKELEEVFEWYAEWLLNDAEKPESLIEWLCDNVNPKALNTIVSTYEFYNKED